MIGNVLIIIKNMKKFHLFGFSPDADFPCIYSEKGLISPFLIMDYSDFKDKDIVLTNIDCNNNALNVVPKYCSCTISIKNNIEDVENFIKKAVSEYNFDIITEKINTNELKITSHGIQAHAAHPDLGINAISRLIIVLDKLFKHYDINIPLLDLFTKYIGLDYNGNVLKINIPDESGELTLNVGQFYLEDNNLKIGLNLRVPINTKFELVENKFSFVCKEFDNVYCEFTGKKEHLYVPKNSFLVETLCKIYNNCTNSNAEPIAIGGATYARTFNNFVSFGANLPGQKDMCHQTDEFISIDNLMIACKIYCEAIFELVNF